MRQLQRRAFLQGLGPLPFGILKASPLPPDARDQEQHKLYWGDLHCHCNISYGEGSLEDALTVAREHLDFCSVVGHAAWPDMPQDREQFGRIIDYHNAGFRKFHRLWPEVKQTLRRFHAEGKFIPFLAYEWHSMKYGDHNVYFREVDDGELILPDTLEQLRSRLRGKNAMMLPHHIAYQTGYRGVNWEYFKPELTPLVEIFSRHGCSETDTGPYPMLHTMGPRSVEGTARAGLARGYHFGFVASSDNHSGFPGNYGDGRLGVYAKSLSAADLWEAFQNRRTYAVTGDRIELGFRLNGVTMGQQLASSRRREIAISVRGEDLIDSVEIIRNGDVIFRRYVDSKVTLRDPITAKIRVEWGWGRPTDRVDWQGRIALTKGKLLRATPYFRGQLLTGPRQGADLAQEAFTPISRITEVNEHEVRWTSTTFGNPNNLTPATCSIVLEVSMPATASLIVEANGKKFSHTLQELLNGTRGHFVRGWLSEAVQIHRAVPEPCYTGVWKYTDAASEPGYYYARVTQRNGQLAWSSPIRLA
jgi:hypothetical protein